MVTEHAAHVAKAVQSGARRACVPSHTYHLRSTLHLSPRASGAGTRRTYSGGKTEASEAAFAFASRCFFDRSLSACFLCHFLLCGLGFFMLDIRPRASP